MSTPTILKERVKKKTKGIKAQGNNIIFEPNGK